MARKGSQRAIERGILLDGTGYAIKAQVRGVRVERRFPPTTPVPVLRENLEALRSELAAMPPETLRRRPVFPSRPFSRSLEGWCYVYVVQVGEHVKIGRTENIDQRLRQLQQAHPEPVHLRAAIPAHAALEAALHAKFQHLRQQGEWFVLGPELEEFIRQVRAGVNPVAMLW